MPSLSCSCCNSVTEDHKAVTCSICKKIFKYSCVDLTVSEVRAINGKKGLSWRCVNCSSLGNDIQALQATLIELKNEILELKRQAAQSNSPMVDNSQFEEILQEMNERQRRKCNVVVFGFKEDVITGVQSRADRDKNNIADMLREISVPENVCVKAIRIGKADHNRNTPRPIKVTVNDEFLTHEIIRKAKNLSNTVRYKDIRISLDRTPRQIDYYKSVKSQLTERIAGGENNLRIKYVRGIPRIVSLN